MKKTIKRRGAKKVRDEIGPTLIEAVCNRLARDVRVRRTLPGQGRLHIDRKLPFLCVYRRPPDNEDAGTERLVKGEASYMIASGRTRHRRGVASLVHRIVELLSGEFGGFLIVEIWAAPDGGKANDPAVPAVSPAFTIHAPRSEAMTRTVDAFEKRLKRFKVLKQDVEVDVLRDDRGHASALRPLLTKSQSRALNCSMLGIAVPPVYRKPNSTEEFPLLNRSLRRSLSLALRQTYFEFMQSRTTHCPPHFHALGRRAVVQAVWKVDRQLAEVSNQFDYLLQLTPVNTNSAWKQLKRARFERTPEFHYPPMPVDPTMLKRHLYKIPIERIEDPALQQLFQEKQEELELKLTMLRNRDTPRFLYTSLQLFGGVEDDLLQLARSLLTQLPGRGNAEKGPNLNAEEFARRAEREIDFYRTIRPEFKAGVRVTEEVSGLIVSRGKLLINSDLSLPASRVEALMAHEVGTHLLTYFNGHMQPFQQLCSGLAGYEELQEGIAVLSEYLVGGLTRDRMRQLAARVVAVRCLIDGASFVDTFRVLSRDYRFIQRSAYTVAMRVYRGGGLTKDMVYLRGLKAILQYVRDGNDLKLLFTGKMAGKHIPIIRELLYRNVLKPVPVLPRYMQEAASLQRLDKLRNNPVSVLDLVNKSSTGNGRPR